MSPYYPDWVLRKKWPPMQYRPYRTRQYISVVCIVYSVVVSIVNVYATYVVVVVKKLD